jgi:hypothetical protein
MELTPQFARIWQRIDAAISREESFNRVFAIQNQMRRRRRRSNAYAAIVLWTAVAVIAALLLATGTAHADCCDGPPLMPAGHAFYVAAKRHFGRGFSSVYLSGEKWRDCSNWDGTTYPMKCDLRSCDEPPPEERKFECTIKSVVVIVKNTRYLGVDKDTSYLDCHYRTKPVIRFFNCIAGIGD